MLPLDFENNTNIKPSFKMCYLPFLMLTKMRGAGYSGLNKKNPHTLMCLRLDPQLMHPFEKG